MHVERRCCDLSPDDSTEVSWIALFECTFDMFARLAEFKEELKHRASKLSLIDTRLRLLSRTVTIDHDHVFALAGLSDAQTDSGLLVAMYNVPASDMFIDISRGYISTTKSLSILSLSGLKLKYPKTPLWAVDWTFLNADSEANGSYQVWMQIASSFNASTGITGCEPKFEQDTLVLQSVALDEIVAVGDALILERDSQEWCQELIGKYLPTDKYPTEPNSTGEQAFFRTLCTDSYWANISAETRPSSRIGEKKVDSFLATYADSICAKFNPWPNQTLGEGRREPAKEDGYVVIIDGRRLFLTRNGLLGSDHKNCDVGDSIYIAAGANMPLILRQKRTSFFRKR